MYDSLKFLTNQHLKIIENFLNSLPNENSIFKTEKIKINAIISKYKELGGQINYNFYNYQTGGGKSRRKSLRKRRKTSRRR